MKVIAIGATGFIGRHVVSQLLDAGEEVAVLHRGKTALPSDWQVTELLGERSTLLDLRDKFRDWSPDVAIDMILSSALQFPTTGKSQVFNQFINGISFFKSTYISFQNSLR